MSRTSQECSWSASEKQGQWHVIEMPAIKDEGTEHESALWPEWYDLESLKRIKSDIGHRDWSALFQQNPRPEEGTFFKREWFEFYTKPPERLNKFATGDFAVTEGDGDFTDIGTHGYAPEGILYLGLDGWYGQTSSDKWIEALIDQFARHQAVLLLCRDRALYAAPSNRSCAGG
jgi:hypothetical protein